MTNPSKTINLTLQRFRHLWAHHLLDPDTSNADTVYHELIARYSEPQRKYHTLTHIDYCMGQFDQAQHLLESPEIIETALWFHDMIYQPGDKDNERLSADRFAALADGYLQTECIRQVQQLILVTMAGTLAKTRNEAFVSDIDLASLALPWDEFRRDSRLIRAEMQHLSDAEYRTAQLKFLNSLKNRPCIYLTNFFRDRLESAAQRNISRHLENILATSAASAGEITTARADKILKAIKENC